MKTIKAKLFSGFALIIFLILTTLSFVSIEFFSYNKENESIELIDETIFLAKEFMINYNEENYAELDKYVDVKEQFVIILKNKQLIFTNESNYKTQKVLDAIFEELEEKDENGKYIYEEGYILNTTILEKNENFYEIFIGIEGDILEEDISSTAFIIIVLNITIFIILLFLGYALINKTIKPLKQILKELHSLEGANDLSKRLQQLKTDDEFEELIVSLNKMLQNIENSVENIKQFSSDASHELRTPLTIIQGEIELIKNKKYSKEELELTLEKINIQQQKLQEIIQNFLLLAKIDKASRKKESASLDKCIFEAIEQNLEKIEEKNLELKFDIEENLEVSFNEKYLNIVLNNLLSNAVKYTNEGFIELCAKKEKGIILFQITDSGIGISKTDIPKIFERFYRVDKVRTDSIEGLGLGLSIVKKICNSYSVDISIQSTLEQGTSFRLVF